MKTSLTLNQIESRHKIIAFVIPVVLLAISAVLLFIGNGITKNAIKNRQELASLKAVNAEKDTFNQFITVNQVNLENIDRVIPNEAMMIGVIQDFESSITKFDPQGIVEIASITPVKIGTYSAITLSIKTTTQIENLPLLLESINQLPYMTQLITSETNVAGDSYHHQISLRLYVQDPFNTP